MKTERQHLVHPNFVRMPRPGGDGSLVGLRVELISTWAPSTDHDSRTHTDVWCGHKITVALPIDEFERQLKAALESDELII